MNPNSDLQDTVFTLNNKSYGGGFRKAWQDRWVPYGGSQSARPKTFVTFKIGIVLPNCFNTSGVSKEICEF